MRHMEGTEWLDEFSLCSARSSPSWKPKGDVLDGALHHHQSMPRSIKSVLAAHSGPTLFQDTCYDCWFSL